MQVASLVHRHLGAGVKASGTQQGHLQEIAEDGLDRVELFGRYRDVSDSNDFHRRALR
jgi:hypothetical protein